VALRAAGFPCARPAGARHGAAVPYTRTEDLVARWAAVCVGRRCALRFPCARPAGFGTRAAVPYTLR